MVSYRGFWGWKMLSGAWIFPGLPVTRPVDAVFVTLDDAIGAVDKAIKKNGALR